MSFITDLSDPKNALIGDSDDAAKLKIGEHELWLPKKHLAYQSPFFAGLFKNNFKEGADSCYDLKGLGDLKLQELLQFIGIVHGLDMPVNGTLLLFHLRAFHICFTAISAEGLLHLADLFQCKVVLRRCENYLRQTVDKRFPLSKKLLLCDRFKLNTLLIEMVDKISVEEWKKLHLPSGISPLLASLVMQKFRLFDL
ncbi:hypothetical protein L596_013196 [Steinernema carpocapsae]|uniref:Uncharacterized protein n=1 Tax=Steinernema carpocapsae TaxID=34508 RepID=A0A4U5NZG4_STECR|nr:hypothetical protein L596_013196 [Steinernema carpocapsae]